MDKEFPTITLTWGEYEELKDAQLLLHCLQAAGVDNWDGYDMAIDTYEEHASGTTES